MKELYTSALKGRKWRQNYSHSTHLSKEKWYG